MNKLVIILVCTIAISGCATQRYGRQTEVSQTEKQYLECKDIRIEIAKTEEFLSNVRMQRRSTNGMHVLGALGDFGIGNSIEGDEAELSGEKRLKALRDLSTQKRCI
jgi:hypothetical protein